MSLSRITTIKHCLLFTREGNLSRRRNHNTIDLMIRDKEKIYKQEKIYIYTYKNTHTYIYIKF